MNLAFPEDIGKPRQGARSLRLSQVLVLVYCFGGASALLALLAKFVVAPLFDELTYERRVFADDARNRLVYLNARLARTVTPPPLKVSASDYVERAVPANESPAGPPRAPDLSEATDKMRSSLRELRQLARQMDPNDDTLRAHSALTSQANELAKYARQIQYETVPTGSIFLSTAATGEPNKPSTILGQAIVNGIKDIRSFKSSLLSS